MLVFRSRGRKMSLQLVLLLVLAPARCFLEAVVPVVVIKGRTPFPAASGELRSAGISWVMEAVLSAGDWLQRAAVLWDASPMSVLLLDIHSHDNLD